ncbi:MAG: hypothetical protein KKG76_06405 [Euryarchaeota archaeon]|nr:hypothetical protein [Euryarchaeota archaeon]
MESKDSKFYPLIVLFFILGLVIGYVIHQPETEIKYINNTIEVPKIVEKIVEVTASPASTAQTPAPTSTQVPDFEVKIYDPEKDKPAQTIEIINWQAMPNKISIPLGNTVLIKVVNYPDRPKPEFIMGSYKQILGTAGQIVVKFNKIGNYDFRVVISSDNPGTLPTEYAKGSIRVY